jgi:6-phosphogluconate dehydrogenase
MWRADKEMPNMELGMIGLGRMGGNMSRRLIQGGHRVVGYNHGPEATRALEREGLVAAFSLAQVVAQLSAEGPRAVWMMIPAGNPVTETVNDLTGMLAPGDIVIDGGNSNYKDSIRRAEQLSAQRIHFLDVGTSGGIWGLKVGFCLMIGGERSAFERLEPIFRTLAPQNGYAHVGPSGAGHFTKMIHNGIEYGIMQAYGEGFEILRASKFNLDLHQIAALWNHGSVVRSWLLELAESALSKDPDLSHIADYVEDSGEGRWTVQTAIDENIPAPVITLSLLARLRSRQDESFSAKLLAALRNEFGGHAVRTEDER